VPEKNEQLIDLQNKFSFQEDMLQQLDEVVTSQALQIDELRRQLQRLEKSLQELSDDQDQPADAEIDEKPPHY